MYTVNDALFCILESSYSDIESSRLIYYMYIFQVAGFNYKLKYKINTNGLSCRQLNEMLSSVVNSDKVITSDGVVRLTPLGRLYYNNVVLTYSEWEKVDHIKSVLDNMSEKELYFLCLVDMLVYDTLNQYGVDGLIKQKNRIQSTLASLCSEYSEDNFNAALKFIKEIKDEK